MLIADWEKVVLVWVNALKLTGEEITDICQLHKSDFFLHLIECLGKPTNEKVNLEANIIEEVIIILKEEFKGYCIVDEPWDSYETTLVTSLLLLLSAFKCHDLRTPLFALHGETQLVIQEFIQKFISIHNLTPLDQISRRLLISSLDELGSGENFLEAEDEENYGENDDLPDNSFKRVLSPLKNSNSPELYRNSEAKIKSLECKLDLVSRDKLHLLDEIEVLKSDLDDLRTRYETKATQVLKLENELFLAKNSCFKLESEPSINHSPITEFNLLKSDFDAISVQLANYAGDLDQEQLKNAELSAKLRKAEEGNILLTEKCAEYDVKLLALQANVDDLEGVVANLKTTVKDQADLLSDSIIVASPRPMDLSLNESAITGETLANVVEIKCTELENELENVKGALNFSKNKIVELELKLKEKDSEIDDLKSLAKEREIFEIEKIDRLRFELKEKTADVEDLREDNEFLSKSFEEKKKDFQRLLSDYNALKSKESRLLDELSRKKNQVQPCSCCSRDRNMDNIDAATVNADLVKEIAQMGHLLESKQVRLEEANLLLEKLKKELSEKYDEKEELLNENRSWKTKFNSIQGKMSELVADLKKIAGEESPNASPMILTNRIASQISSLNCRIQHLIQLNDKYENELTGRKEEVISQTKATQMANSESIDLRDQLRTVETELESTRGLYRVRGTELLALQQTVSMCEHEKAILQRRIDLLNVDVDKCENLKGEVNRLKSFVTNLEVELASEKLEHKRLKEQVDIHEKVNVAFDSKLSSLQSELKSQYDKELARASDEFNEKINQYKRRMQRDKNHIKELSSELWEASDRYLLASQEADALRNQLRRTKTALQLVTDAAKSAPQNDESYLRSAPCLWTEGESSEDYDERLTVTRERRVRRSSGGANSVWSEAFSKIHLDDESFGDCFLEDLKAGIVRLPQDNLLTRASCPPPLKANESSGCEKFTNDKQSLLPPEKPKRKDQVAYCRPGPPTPSKNARLSLQSLDRVSHSREVPLRNRPPPSQPNRLSRLFSTISSKTKSGSVNLQTAAAPTKRKSFFRKFGTNRENIPPPWH